MSGVNFSNFTSHYLLHPFSSELSKKEKAICLVASLTLGFLTFGLLHFAVAVYQWKKRIVTNQTFEHHPSNKKVSVVAAETFSPVTTGPKRPRPIDPKKLKDFINRSKSSTPEAIKSEFKQLLEQNFDVKRSRADLEDTPLHQIAKFGEPLECLEIIANYGIDFNTRDIYGNTPLLWAIANAKNTMALEIIKYDQNFNIMGKGLFENAPLHLAVVKGYTTEDKNGKTLNVTNLMIVEKLLEKKANPNLKNHLGYTPLHYACIRKDYAMIEVLLKYGADSSLKSPEGISCIDLLKMPLKEADIALDKVTGEREHQTITETDVNLIQTCIALLSQSAPNL